jgi:ribose transport system ATP-binding protein
VQVFVCDEPTRGVDVGAKAEIYGLLNALVEQGAGVLMVSSELQEVIGLCDRVMVMCAGAVAGVLARGGEREPSPERVMDLATGGTG